MQIALVTEGTYPYYTGGVSVWCHQLIEGMPDHAFHAVAVSVNGLEKSIWTSPPNLLGLTNLPLWGYEPVNRKCRGAPPPAWFEQVHLTFLRSLIRPAQVLGHRPLGMYNTFLNSLHALFRYAQEADLAAALLSNASVERLMDLWHSSEMDEELEAPGAKPKPILTLADALMVSDFLEHLLRPLSHPPLEVDLVHSAMSGLSTMIGMAAKWTSGTPFVLSEHGIYLRERYLSYLHDPLPYGVKMLLLNFFRLPNCAPCTTEWTLKSFCPLRRSPRTPPSSSWAGLTRSRTSTPSSAASLWCGRRSLRLAYGSLVRCRWAMRPTTRAV